MDNIYTGTPSFVASGFQLWLDKERRKVQEKKEMLYNKATEGLFNMLKQKCADILLNVVEDKLNLDETADTFSGELQVEAKLMDGSGHKTVYIPIQCSKNELTLPTPEIIDEVLSLTSSEEQKDLQRERESFKKYNEQLEEKAKVEVKKLQEVLSGEKSQSKQAFNAPPLANALSTIQINSYYFPETMKVGDTIDVDGLVYRLVNKNSNSADPKTSGGVWTFQLVVSPTKDDVPEVSWLVS